MTRSQTFLFCFLALFVSQTMDALEETENKLKLEFVGIPGVSYTSDGGFGFGVIGSMYGRSETIKPYVLALDAQIFLSTEGQHSHFVRLDWLKAFSLPLRLRARIGYIATSNQNFCGLGASASCAEPAENQNFYLVRFSEKIGKVEGRWLIKESPHQIELTTSFRGSFYEPGSFDTSTPYPGSAYELLFPEGERGFAGVFEMGAMFDNRDQEASPTSGYWIETSFRESTPVLGSAWEFFGANLSARGYLAIDTQKRLVLAGQFIFDGMVGDAPVAEIARVGNSQGFIAFGGPEIGRGLREQYFPGRLKILEQIELRYRFVEFDLFSQQFSLSAMMFGDIGMIASRIEQLGIETKNKKTILGFGSGLRLIWNTDFVIRLDLGFSPIEAYTPKIYLKVGNVF